MHDFNLSFLLYLFIFTMNREELQHHDNRQLESSHDRNLHEGHEGDRRWPERAEKQNKWV